MAVSFVGAGAVHVQPAAANLDATLTLPSGLLDGDVVYAPLSIRTVDTVDPVVTAPAGWTLLASAYDTSSGTGTAARLYACPYAAGMAAPRFTTATSMSSATGGTFALRGGAMPTAGDVSATAETGASANLRTTGPVDVAEQGWLIGMFTSRTGETWTSSDLTERLAGMNAATGGATGYVGTSGPHPAGSYTRSATMDPASSAATKVAVAVAPSASVTVDAGQDQTVEPWTEVTVTATSSETTVTWAQVAGPTVALTGSGLSRTFTAPAALAAERTVVLRATASDGTATATDDVTVTSRPATDALVGDDDETLIPIRLTVLP